MKKLLPLLCALFLVHSASQAQAFLNELGKVTREELDMTEYELDPEATAVVLFQMGKYHYVPDDTRGQLKLVMEYITRIKILRPAGQEYAQFEIPYYAESDYEIVSGIEGATYNAGAGDTGIVSTPVTQKNIFREAYYRNKWQVVKVAMPDARPGSVVELAYRIESFSISNMRHWNFQWDIPVVYSSLEYRAIPYYEFAYMIRGTKKMDESTTVVDNHEIRFGRYVYREAVVRMAKKDVPALHKEDFVPAPDDYRIRMTFELAKVHYPTGGSTDYMSTWPKINEELLREPYFGKYMNATQKEGARIIPLLGLEGKSPLGKAKAVTDHVKGSYSWNDERGLYAPEKLATVMKNKSGNVAELNLLLCGLLRAAGLDATPAVLSTRDRGTIDKKFPFSRLMNYVIVYLRDGDQQFYLDATDPMRAFGELPGRCSNVEALVVNPAKEEWIETVQRFYAATVKQFAVSFDSTLVRMNVAGSVKSYYGDAYHYRAACRGKEEDLLRLLEERGAKPEGGVRITNYNDDLSQPFLFTYNGVYDAEQGENKLFVAPFANQSVTPNRFKQTERTLPLDLTLLESGTYTSTVLIPEGYTVEHLPAEYSVDNEMMKVTYSAHRTNNIIQVSAKYQTKQIVFPAVRYAALKEGWDRMAEKFNERIVLVRP